MPPVLYRQAEAGRHRWSGRALRAPLRAPGPQEVSGSTALAATATSSGSGDPREALLRAKLNAVVRHQWGPGAAGTSVAAPFLNGAGLRPTTAGGAAWVLADGASSRSLGPVLVWALRHQAGQVHLVADSSEEVASVLARRAAEFAIPIKVWRLDPPEIRESAPAEFFPSPPLPAEAAPWAEMLRSVGLEPVVEFGVLTGEFLGLEVARVVDGQLEVGVGQQDRRAHRDLEPNRAPEDQLAEVLGMIRRFRCAEGSAHLAHSLAQERWLRRVIVARPELVGAAWLAPMPPAVPRADLRTPTAAMASGVDLEGRPVVVAASTGIDLDLVPAAADARRASGLAGARLILAVAPADDHPRTRQVAAHLREPAEVVTVPAEWKAVAGTL